MSVFRPATVVVGPLQKYDSRGFLAKTRELLEWMCVLLLVSYWCDIPGAEEMSAASHGVAVTRLCVTFMVTGDDIIRNGISSEKFIRETKMIENCFIKTQTNYIKSIENVLEIIQEEDADCGEELQRKNFLLTWQSFLETLMKSHRKQGMRFNSVIIFGSLHRSHPYICRLV